MHTPLSVISSALVAVTLLAGTPIYARQPAGGDKQPANVVIHLPADAELFIEGIKSKQVGATREFETPALRPGKVFTYNLKAVWTEDGKEVVKELKVKVEAGKTTEIDVTKPVVEAPPPPPPGSFKLELPAKVLTLVPGGKQTVTIRVRRDNFKDAVKVTFRDLPAGVQVKEALIPAEKDTVDIEVAVADKVAAGPASVTVEASADKLLEKGTLKLSVEKPASVLTIKLPADPTVHVRPGAEVRLPVSVERKNVDGPVSVTFANLPKGVTIQSFTIPPGAAASEVMAVAAKDAAPGDAKIQIVATAGDVTNRAELTLTVEKADAPKPAVLRLEAPARLTADAGKPVTVAVKVVRENFEGPVTVTFEGVPDTGKPAEMVIPAGKDAGTFDITIAKDANKDLEVKILAKGGGTKGESALKIAVTPVPVVVEKPAKLKLDVPAAVEVLAGGKAAVTIKVMRENVEGPVELSFAGLTNRLPNLTIPADKSEANVEISMAAASEPGTTDVKVLASAGAAKAEAVVKVRVKAADKPVVKAGKITLAMPEVLKLTPGGAKLFPVKVQRENVEGTVKLEFSGLPEGVKIKEVTVPADKTQVYLDVSATPNAPEGDAEIKITASTDKVKNETVLKVKVAK